MVILGERFKGLRDTSRKPGIRNLDPRRPSLRRIDIRFQQIAAQCQVFERYRIQVIRILGLKVVSQKSNVRYPKTHLPWKLAFDLKADILIHWRAIVGVHKRNSATVVKRRIEDGERRWERN